MYDVKPMQGSMIDPLSVYSDALVGYYPFNNASGPVSDLASTVPPIVPSALSSWSSGRWGPCLRLGAGQWGEAAASSETAKPTTAITLVVGYTPGNTPGSQPLIVGRRHGYGDISYGIAHLLYNTFYDSLAYLRVSGTNYNSGAGFGTLISGVPYILALRWQTGDYLNYRAYNRSTGKIVHNLNSSTIASGTIDYSNGGNVSEGKLLLGRYDNIDSSSYAPGDYDIVGIFSRRWSDDELGEFVSSPWQIIQSPSSRRFFSTPQVAAGKPVVPTYNPSDQLAPVSYLFPISETSGAIALADIGPNELSAPIVGADVTFGENEHGRWVKLSTIDNPGYAQISFPGIPKNHVTLLIISEHSSESNNTLIASLTKADGSDYANGIRGFSSYVDCAFHDVGFYSTPSIELSEGDVCDKMMVIDGDTMRFYVDGIFIGSATQIEGEATGDIAKFTIGASPFGNINSTDKIYFAAVIPRSCTQSDATHFHENRYGLIQGDATDTEVTIAPVPIPSIEVVPDPIVNPNVNIDANGISTSEVVPGPNINTSDNISPEPIPTSEVVPDPNVNTNDAVEPAPISTSEVVSGPTIDPIVIVAPAPILGSESVSNPVIMPVGLQVPIEPIGGLITRTITSTVWKTFFNSEMYDEVPEKLMETPYVTIEFVGEVELGSVRMKRKSYIVIDASYIVTVIGKNVGEVANAFRVLELVLGNFSMKRNRIQLKYGEICSITIANGRLSASKESDDSGNLIRWKKADLHAIYTKRFPGV